MSLRALIAVAFGVALCALSYLGSEVVRGRQELAAARDSLVAAQLQVQLERALVLADTAWVWRGHRR